MLVIPMATIFVIPDAVPRARSSWATPISSQAGAPAKGWMFPPGGGGSVVGSGGGLVGSGGGLVGSGGGFVGSGGGSVGSGGGLVGSGGGLVGSIGG